MTKMGFFCVSLNLSCCLTLSGLSQRPKIAIFTRCISGPPISHPVLPYASILEPDSWQAHRPWLWPCLGATRIKFLGRLRGCMGQFRSRGAPRVPKKISFFSIIKVRGQNLARGGRESPRMLFELELFFNLVFKTAIGMSIGPTVKELEPFSRPHPPANFQKLVNFRNRLEGSPYTPLISR